MLPLSGIQTTDGALPILPALPALLLHNRQGHDAFKYRRLGETMSNQEPVYDTDRAYCYRCKGPLGANAGSSMHGLTCSACTQMADPNCAKCDGVPLSKWKPCLCIVKAESEALTEGEVQSLLHDVPSAPRSRLQICVGCGGPWPRVEKLQTPLLGETGRVTMTGEELIKEHKAITDKMHQICKDKNADYAGQGGNADAFANLSMIEVASHGAISAEHGFLTRMSDKWSRLISLLTSGKAARVKNESLEDTLLDLANYCLLLAIYLRNKRANEPKA